MTQKNNDKLKKIFKRLYLIVTTIMSILFIVLCVIAGCGSSNNQQQQLNEQKEMIQNEVIKLPNYLPMSNIYINGTFLFGSVGDNSYTILSNGIDVEGVIWIYSGNGTFLGFSETQGSTTPDADFEIGDIGSFLGELYLYSVASQLRTYNTITLTNTFYPSDYLNRSFTYDVDTTYSTFGDWYNSGTSPLYLIENSYYGWRGLGAIRYYYSNGWVNVTSNVSLSLQNLELQYYASDYTQLDLNEQYSLGYDAGYDAGYDYGFEVGEQNGYNQAVSDLQQPIDLVLSSSTNFMYIYGDTYLEKYLPNVYFNRSLNDFYQSTYDFNDITFKVRGDQTHIFDIFRINFGRISDYNFDISNTSTPVTYLAFVNENVTLYDTYTDYSSFEGCTNYINLLIENVPASNYNQYYFVKSIQYIDSTNNYTLDVFNGVRTKGDMIYYTQNSSTGGGSLVATSVQHNGTYFVKNGWLNDSYRQLEVLTYSETLMDVPNSNLNNMTFKDFLTYSYEKNMVLTNDVNDIYSLFSGAFGAVGGLLSVQVFPFITLGTLIFVPLIAGIIMIIIKILKKG